MCKKAIEKHPDIVPDSYLVLEKENELNKGFYG